MLVFVTKTVLWCARRRLTVVVASSSVLSCLAPGVVPQGCSPAKFDSVLFPTSAASQRARVSVGGISTLPDVSFLSAFFSLCLAPVHQSPRSFRILLAPTTSPLSQAKKLVENALLSKLQEAQAQVEETQAALAVSEERAAALETDRARQGAAVSALTKQLQDANRSVRGGRGQVLDCDVLEGFTVFGWLPSTAVVLLVYIVQRGGFSSILTWPWSHRSCCD